MTEPEEFPDFDREEQAFRASLRESAEVAGFRPLDPASLRRAAPSPRVAGWAKGIAAAAAAVLVIGGLAFGLSQLRGSGSAASAAATSEPGPVGGAAPEASTSAAASAETDNTGGGPMLSSLGWQNIADAPLAGREKAASGYLDGRYYLVGGQHGPLCPQDARCKAPERLRDGAGYDPETDTWTRIADAPVDLVKTTGVAAQGRLYFLTGSADAPVVVAYDASADSWARLPAPQRPIQLVAAGDELVSISDTSRVGGGANQRWDADADRWVDLPEDPLGGGTVGRSAAWADGRLVLTGVELGPADAPERTRIATLAMDTMTWTELASADFIAAKVSAVDDILVWADARGEPSESKPRGARLDVQLLDLTAGTSTTTPRPDPVGGLAEVDGVVVGTFLGVNGSLLDPRQGSYQQPGPPASGNRIGQTVIGGPTGLLVFGGRQGRDLTASAQFHRVD